MTSTSHNVRVQLRDGSWLVDWDVVAKIERAKYRAVYRCACEPKPVPREGISSLWMPEVSTLDVDFDHVNAKADAKVAHRLTDLKHRMAIGQLSGELLRHELAADQEATESAAAKFRKKLQQVSAENMKSINAKDQSLGAWKKYAETTRNLSAEILVIGATAMAAPAIAVGGLGAAAGSGGAWLAGASVFKGIAKFQDTSSVGAAMMEATSTFGFAVLTPAADLKGAKNIAVIFLAKMPVNTVQGYVEGRSHGKPLIQALKAAAADAAAEAVTSKILESARVEQVMRKLTIPVSVSLKVRREVGKEFRKGAVEKVGERAVTKGIENLSDFVAEAGRTESHEDAPRPFKNLVATGSHVFDAVLDQAVRRSPEHAAHRPAAHEKLHAGHAR